MTKVLMVSKAVVPPWNDSSKNLVRDIVLGTDRTQFVVLTDGSHSFDLPHIIERPVYRGAGRFAPSIRQKFRVLGSLLRRGNADLQHFFFAPNPGTVGMLKRVRLFNRRPSVHTICSVPESFEGVEDLLFADINVALSQHTRDRIAEHGVPDVRLIPPCIPPLEPIFDEAERARLKRAFGLPETGKIVLFPGDYEFSNAAETVAQTALKLEGSRHDITWVFACRIKRAQSREIEADIRTKLATIENDGRALFLNNVDNILDLVAASELVLMPAESTYAKMDLPLILLEAMAIGRPIVVADRPPLNELPTASVGFSVEPNSPTALADLVSGAFDDPADLKARGLAGAKIVKERFNREIVANLYSDMYQELS